MPVIQDKDVDIEVPEIETGFKIQLMTEQEKYKKS